MDDKKPIQRIAPEYLEVGRLWLDARASTRGGNDPYPADGQIKDYHLLSACHDSKSGYGVLIVVHRSKSDASDAEANHADPQRRTFAVLRFVAVVQKLWRRAMQNTLFGGKPPRKGGPDAPDSPAGPSA